MSGVCGMRDTWALDEASTLRRLFGRLHDIEQLHVKDDGGTGLDERWRTALAIGELGRTHQAALAAYVHALYPFGPALDDPL